MKHYKLIVLIGFIVLISCSKKGENDKSGENENFQKNKVGTSYQSNQKTNENSDDNTWSILSQDKALYKEIIATRDNGFAFLKQEKEIGTLLCKYNSDGSLDFEKTITNSPNSKLLLAVTEKNEFVLILDDNIIIADSDGEILKEKNLSSTGILGDIWRVYSFGKEILILSEYTLLKLDSEFNLLKEIHFSDIYSRLTESNIGRKLEINSIAEDSEGNYYFTGGDNDILWYGKLDKNLNVLWEKSDLSTEFSKEKPEKGIGIICVNNNNIVILSKFESVNRYVSAIIGVDSNGNDNFRGVIAGVCDKKPYDFLVKQTNYFYAITLNRTYLDRSDIRTFNSNNWEYAVLNKIEFTGKVISSENIEIDNKKISFRGSSSSTGQVFFICGQVQNLSPTNIRFISHSSVTKFNADGKTKNSIIEY